MPYFDHALLPVPCCEQVRHGPNGKMTECSRGYHEMLISHRETKAKVRHGRSRKISSEPCLTLGSWKVRHGRSQEFCSGPCLTWPRSPGPRSKAWPGAGIQARPCLTLAFVLQWKSQFCGNCPFVSGHSAGFLVCTGGAGSKTWSRAAFFRPRPWNTCRAPGPDQGSRATPKIRRTVITKCWFPTGKQRQK